MGEQPDLREQFRTLAARFDLPVDALLADIAQFVEKKMPRGKEIRSPLPLTRTTMRAAISDSYTPAEFPSGDDTSELLNSSEVVMIGGKRRLRLADAARREVLQGATQNMLFTTLLDEQISADHRTGDSATSEADARSVWLRRFLKGEEVHLDGASPTELRCAVAARERLEGVDLRPDLPNLNELRRLLDHAELLEPLRISIGAEGPWSEVPKHDRFVGRTKELKTLRSFVDEIEAESKLEAVQRGVSSVAQNAFSLFGRGQVPGIRIIVAGGGLGKSALIAKFLLDHALKQRNRFPFVYLDFDRAALQPRDPRQLLLEVARQVALQFPEVEADLNHLRARIRQALNETSQTPGGDPDPFDDFRSLLRARVTMGNRAMLVVLDTLEIVQRDTTTLGGVVAFLERMSSGGFTELRVVVAGRAQVPELMGQTPSRAAAEVIRLEALSVSDAREMVKRLGDGLMPSQWKDEWSQRIAGAASDKSDRREPLSLRIAVETIRDTESSKRDEKSLEIEKLGEGASYSFVGKLYERRIIEHIGDPRARKIAWPGLVVRRVTVAIIRDLLAEPCGLDPEDSQAAFDSLSREVWIVSRVGDALVHLADLRARTLPLMRTFDPSKSTGRDAPSVTFGEVNAAAVEYFSARKTLSVSNYAEWIYHRLLGGESVLSVDKDWKDELAPLLQGAEEDFPDASAGADYLAARTSRELVSAERFRRLEPRLALFHLARTGAQKGDLVEQSLDPMLLELRLREIEPTDENVRTTIAVLKIKCGFWWPAVVANDFPPSSAWIERASTAFSYYHARLMAGSETVPNLQPMDNDRSWSRDYATPAAVHQIALARIHGFDWFVNVDELFARFVGGRSSSAEAGIALPMLRTAIVFGDASALSAARLWIGLFRERIRANHQIAFSGAEVGALSDEPEFSAAAQGILHEFGLAITDFRDPVLVRGTPCRFDQPPLVDLVIKTLLLRCERGSVADLSALKRFAAARDEDWLVPIAYAAHRATKGTVPKGIADLFEAHQPGTRSFLRRNVLSRTSVSGDILEVLRRADEASDLAGAARVFVKGASTAAGEDLLFLLNRYDEWRHQIQRFVHPPPTLA